MELTLNDRFIDPVEEGVDVTVRIAALADSSLIARKLASAPRVLAAAPAYLERHGIPQSPDDLKRHHCLNYGHTTLMQRWTLVRDGLPVSVPINSVLCSNNGDVLRAAALAGNGIAKLPTFIIGRDLKQGRLRPVLEAFPATELVSMRSTRRTLPRREDARPHRLPRGSLRRPGRLVTPNPSRPLPSRLPMTKITAVAGRLFNAARRA